MEMICLIALVVFGITGLFSATHRAFAKEAFDCVFRKMTLRKCSTGFDEKMKMKIVGKLINRSPGASRIVYKHFELISWIFTVILFLSLAYSAYSVYNLAVYGTCDLQQPENCVFTPGVTTAAQMQDRCECDFALDQCTQPDFQACGTDCQCLSQTCGPGKTS